MANLLGTQSMQTCRMREPSKRKEPGHIDEIQPLEREHKMVVNIIHKWVGIFFEGIFLVSCTYREVPSSNRSCLEAHVGFFRLLMYCDLLTKSRFLDW